MRLISAALTTDQIIQSVERVKRGEPPVKDVTRRLGWLDVKVGERLQVCRKVMGRRQGEPLERLAVIEVVSVRREPLEAITKADVLREGFTSQDIQRRTATTVHYGTAGTGTAVRAWKDFEREWFIEFFCATHKGCTPQTVITRIEFKYVVSP